MQVNPITSMEIESKGDIERPYRLWIYRRGGVTFKDVSWDFALAFVARFKKKYPCRFLVTPTGIDFGVSRHYA